MFQHLICLLSAFACLPVWSLRIVHRKNTSELIQRVTEHFNNDKALTQRGTEHLSNDNCRIVHASPEAKGCEDLVAFTENLLITGEADLETMWGDDWRDGDPLNAKPGNLMVVDASDPSNPTLTRIDRINFPEGVDFQPHGMYYLPEGNLLHVVNHAYTRGGERIDVFRIVPGADGSSIPTAEWLYAWKNDVFTQQANGVLNDVAVVDADHLFVTRYQDTEPEQGRQRGSGTWHGAQYFLFGARTTEFYYCTRDPAADTSSCVSADGGFGMANGIGFGNDEKTLLYVVDLYAQELRSYRVDRQADNALSSEGAMSMPQRADNIEWNQFHKRMFLGAIGWFPGWGGADEFIPDQQDPTSTAGVSTLVLHRGSMLTGISSSNYANGNLFMGSHKGAGVLACPHTLAATRSAAMPGKVGAV